MQRSKPEQRCELLERSPVLIGEQQEGEADVEYRGAIHGALVARVGHSCRQVDGFTANLKLAEVLCADAQQVGGFEQHAAARQVEDRRVTLKRLDHATHLLNGL